MASFGVLNRQEPFKKLRCLRGVLLGKKVTSLNALPLYIVRPLPPDSQRATIPSVESVEWSADGPQMQHRTRYTPRLFLIHFIMLDI